MAERGEVATLSQSLCPKSPINNMSHNITFTTYNKFENRNQFKSILSLVIISYFLSGISILFFINFFI